MTRTLATGPRRAKTERRFPRVDAAGLGATLASAPHALCLGAVAAIYGALTLLVLRRDFLEYNADGYSRIIRGHEWLDAPRWEVGVWLPLHTWLYGAGFALYHDLSVTPRVINALLTAATLVFLYVIGSTIGGRVAGLVGASIGAMFPWVVWMGVSGMSEPLFHATLAGGGAAFTRWLYQPSDRLLMLAALGIALATMTRYEGWFYAAVFVPLALAVAWRRSELTARTLAIVSVAALFPLIWMQQHWQHYDDPFAFAGETAAIKASLEPENATAGLLRRLTVYPEEAARLAPWLALLCALAVVYALYRRVRWWPLIALAGGQAILLVAVSAGYSNLGPGAERYLLSNVILLFPVLAACAMLVPLKVVRIAAVVVILVATTRMLPTLLDPPTVYPDGDVRELARVVEPILDAAAAGDRSVPALFPDPSTEGYNASYALRILSGHPDAWLVIVDPAIFSRWVADTHPPVWVLDAGVDVTPPPGETRRVGRFLIGGPGALAGPGIPAP
ncbi:MAG TPA: hypothetical protein VMM78_02230 [Thermomicrobiales bacterium]|nr:hypothetical protein [Thermomicrobiales bacterium]